jgi:RND family efflux transporter MFP subunit
MKTADIMRQKNLNNYHKMQSIRLTGIIILSVVTTILTTAGCSNRNTLQAVIQSGNDTVEVFPLKKVQVNKLVTFPAELTPLNRAEIYAKVSGYIKNIQVDIGDRVKKGEVLAILDAPEVISNYAQFYSDEQTAYSKYMTGLDAYKRILNASRVSGTIAAEEMEKAKNQMHSDSSAYEAAKSKLNSNAQLKDYLTIRSPFNGIITQRNFDPGTLVGTNNPKALFIIEDVEKLRLRIPVPEAYTMASPDTTVIQFTVDAQPGKTFSASLSRKSGSVNLSNRTELWEYIYQNKDAQLKSGMFATASIKFRRKDLSFLVPESSVVTNQERRFVIRLNNNRAELIDVKNGISQDDKVEIFGKLTEGDLILVRATDDIKPGTKLTGKIRTQ